MDKWMRSQTVALLKEYEKHPVLYNVKHKDHFKKTKRAEAYHIMANRLQRFKPGVSADELKKKINGIQMQFVKQKKKIDSSISSGEECKPTLWCYPYLHFLSDPQNTAKFKPDHDEVVLEDYISSSESSDSHISLSNPKISAVANDAVQQFHDSEKNTLNVTSNFFNATVIPKTKQHIFCDFLHMELHEIKLDQTFDYVALSIVKLVRKAVKEERRIMQHANMWTPKPTSATMPFINSNDLQNTKNVYSTEAGQEIFE